MAGILPAQTVNMLINSLAGYTYSDYGITEIASLMRMPISFNFYTLFDKLRKSDNWVKEAIDEVPKSFIPFLRTTVQYVLKAQGVRDDQLTKALELTFNMDSQKEIYDNMVEMGFNPDNIPAQYRKAIGIDLYYDKISKKAEGRKVFKEANVLTDNFFNISTTAIEDRMSKSAFAIATLESLRETAPDDMKPLIDKAIAFNKRDFIRAWSKLPKTVNEVKAESTGRLNEDIRLRKALKRIAEKENIDINSINSILEK